MKEPCNVRRDRVLEILRDHRDDLQRQYGVRTLALFGSVARDEATASSDVDLLVTFDREVGLFALFRLQDHLEEILGCSVDLGTLSSLKPRVQQTILEECIDVA